MTYFFNILDEERFLCLPFTLGLLTWAPGQGVLGRKEGARGGEGGSQKGKESQGVSK